jgi:hypothetical protein
MYFKMSQILGKKSWLYIHTLYVCTKDFVEKYILFVACVDRKKRSLEKLFRTPKLYFCTGHKKYLYLKKLSVGTDNIGVYTQIFLKNKTFSKNVF